MNSPKVVRSDELPTIRIHLPTTLDYLEWEDGSWAVGFSTEPDEIIVLPEVIAQNVNERVTDRPYRSLDWLKDQGKELKPIDDLKEAHKPSDDNLEEYEPPF